MGKYSLAARKYEKALKFFFEGTTEIPARDRQAINTSMVKACLNLAEYYSSLSDLRKAYEVLGHIWRPESRLAIDGRHSLFLRMSRLMVSLKKKLELEDMSHTKVSVFLQAFFSTIFLLTGKRSDP